MTWTVYWPCLGRDSWNIKLDSKTKSENYAYSLHFERKFVEIAKDLSERNILVDTNGRTFCDWNGRDSTCIGVQEENGGIQ